MRELVALAGTTALVVHQVIRRYQPYTPFQHASFLVLVPALLSSALAPSPLGTRGPIGTLLIVFPLYVSSLGILVIAYRLSPFHPLSRYPGPVVARISKFWMAALSLSGDQHKYIKSLHERYGDVVRTGPNELSVRDPSAASVILGSPGLPKGTHFYGRMLEYKPRMMIAIHDHDEHARRRRPWLRGLSPAAVKGYNAFIAQRSAQMCNALEEQSGVVRLDEWVNYFAYDFMTDMAFGGGSELLSGQGKDNFWAILDGNMRMATVFGHLPWLGILLGYVPAVVAPVTALIDRCAEFARARVKRGSSKPDLFHYLSGEDDPSRPPASEYQLIDDGILAMVAGADTTSSAMTSIFACLLSHPETYNRLQAEVDKYYPPGEDPLDSRHHKEMSYLNAVINEGLRLFPPVPGGTQRMVPADGQGTAINGLLYFPPGTHLWVHTWSLHRDPRNFYPEPEGFWPDRWLLADNDSLRSKVALPGGVSVAEFKHNGSAFTAFSQGPMNCVGRALAMQEMSTLLCSLLQRFEVRTAPEGAVDGQLGGLYDMGRYEDEYQDFFVTARASVPVVLQVRQGKHA
ncbi:cytochrome P450 [Epithele typhae]|uniref:cytochrome P450 n=1 Tax=Epithele typhae TaxID=378194 RepID=UPI00200796FD|nr:cytochrome P450 [Epithele typhae]KAH9925355.1 cytochrome P450 [Epithele typhae]